jgi:hypothetical protein
MSVKTYAQISLRITLETADAKFCSSDRFAVGNFEIDSGHFVAFFF